MVSLSRYKPWGESDGDAGTKPTDYGFTGQRSMDYIGLDWYSSRWYDSYLNRWASPDPIIPNPYNPLDWDRYQYVDSNPINLSDPTGYKPCDGQNSGSDECDQVTTDDLKEVINWTFDWTTKGDFSKKDLEKIIDTGNKIANYVTSNTNNWGTGWVRSNLGNAVFEQDGWSNWFTTNVVGRPAATLYSTILLQTGSWSVYIIMHELGHVLDDNTQIGSEDGPADIFGGGAADKMVKDMGGLPGGCLIRFYCNYFGVFYFEFVAGRNPWPRQDYANSGVAEDFAETFVNTIVNPSIVPSGRVDWMKKNIFQ